jgi:cytochrome c peroxidase
MAMASEADVVNRLAAYAEYRHAFRLAFPDQAEGVTFGNVARAIAAFERTLVSQARFDRYLAGQTDALTLQEKNGLLLFVDAHCVQCHNGILVGGRSLEKVGIYHSYWNHSDLGRYAVTQWEGDRFVFKVAMLRNVTLTAPYFFDGQVATLPEAVRLMAWMQLDTELDPAEVDEIVSFLGTLEAQHLPDRRAARGLATRGLVFN